VKKESSKWEEMFQKDGKSLLKSKRAGTPPWIIPRLVIEEVGEDNKSKMISEDTGILVWTVQEAEQNSYYAVTAVTGGNEDKTLGAGNTAGPIAEKLEPIGATRYYIQETPSRSYRSKLARDKIKKLQKDGKEIPADLQKQADAKSYYDWYIMYMPYHEWNVDYMGYAFPFHLNRAAFEGYAKSKKVPGAQLDGLGTMNVFAAGYANYGTGDFSRNGLPTWYCGYGTKVKNRASGMDVKQDIRNFIQYRIMQSVLFARRKYNITEPRFHINGNSMGATGCIGFALAFPKFVTTIWSNEGLTDFANITHKSGKTMWLSSVWGNLGKPELENKMRPIPFGDPQLDWVMKHDGMNVFDFRNVAKFLEKNMDTSFPYLNIGHCHQDGSIPAHSQAYPFEKFIRNSRQTFSYCISKGGHGWGQAWGNATRMSNHVTWDQSRPGFSNVPAVIGWRYNRHKDESSRTYMYKVSWGAKGKKISGKEIPVVDTETEWKMALIHEGKEGLEQDYFVDITPRNLQKLKVKEGDTFTFKILTLTGEPLTITDFSKYVNGDQVKDKFKNAGEIKGDKYNLLLIPNVPIHRSGCIVYISKK
jgi:hypothetical protein